MWTPFLFQLEDTMRRLFTILACSLLLNIPTTAAPKPLELTTRVAFTSAPGAFRFTIRIAPDAGNRAWCIEVDGTNYYRGSCLPIADGLKEAVVRQVMFDGVPGGRYEARAWVCRATIRNLLECPRIGAQKVKIQVQGGEPGAEGFEDDDPAAPVGL